LLALACAAAAGTGCSLKSRPDRAKLSIAVLPGSKSAGARLSVARVVQPGALPGPTLGTGAGEGGGQGSPTAPETIDGFTCIAVNVTGSGIDASPGSTDICMNPDTPPAGFPAYFGAVGGFVPLATGGVIEVEIPSGPQRLVQVIAVTTSSGSCPSAAEALADPAARTSLGEPYDVGRVVLDIFGDTEAVVTNDYDPLNPRRVACSGGGPQQGTPAGLAIEGQPTVTVGVCTPYFVSVRDQYTSYTYATTDLLVTLTGAGAGSFHADSACGGAPIPDMTIYAGTNGTGVFYRNLVAESVVLGAGAAGLAAASFPVTVEVVEPHFLSYLENPAVYTVGASITPNSLNFEGSPATFTVSPSLPAGLSIDSSSGMITGTPAAVSSSAIYRVTGANDGGSNFVDLTLTVNDMAPTGLTYGSSTSYFQVGQAGSSGAPSNGGGAVVSYEIAAEDLPLPPGLAFNPGNGEINGTCTGEASGIYTVLASNSGGSTQVDVTIVCEDPVVLSAVMPQFGPLGGTGTGTVTLTGTGFKTGAAIYFGGEICQVTTVTSPVEAVCTGTPPKAAGSYEVQLVNPSGFGGVLAAAYEYAIGPDAISITPQTGAPTGTTITIAGNHFRSAGISVSVGGTACQAVTFQNSSSVTCLTPALTAGSYTVTVENGDGQYDELPGAFTVLPAPTLASITPAQGYDLGGRLVTLSGTGFQSGVVVTFNGVPATNVTLINAGMLSCVTPAGSVGSPTVTITNPDAQFATSNVAFNYIASPLGSSTTTLAASALYAPSDGFAVVTLTVVPRLASGEQAPGGKTVEIRADSGTVTFEGGTGCRTPSSACMTAPSVGGGAYSIRAKTSSPTTAVFSAVVAETEGDVPANGLPTVYFDTTQFTTISANTTITSGNAGQNLYVTNETATFDPTTVGQTFGDIFVHGAGALSHAVASTDVNRIDITARSLNLNTTGNAINASAKGYPATKGYAASGLGTVLVPGTNQGGSHGGLGGNPAGGITAITFGNYREPRHGGGGGPTGMGAGGGVVRITATQACAIRNYSAIVADGGNAAGGGSVHLNCPYINTADWTGVVTANGGPASGSTAGGGGGRIAIETTDPYGPALYGAMPYPLGSSALGTFRAIAKARGGAHLSSVPGGGAGTVYLRHSQSVHGDLLIDNGAPTVLKGGGVTRLVSLAGNATSASGTTLNFTATSTPTPDANHNNLYAGMKLRPDLTFTNTTGADWTDDNVVTVATNGATSFALTSTFSGSLGAFRSIDLLDHLEIGGLSVVETNGDIYVSQGSLSNPGGSTFVISGIWSPSGTAGFLYPGASGLDVALSSGDLATNLALKGRNLTISGAAVLTAGTIALTGDVNVSGTASPHTLSALSIFAANYTQTSGTVLHPVSTATTQNRLMLNLSGTFTMSGGSINLLSKGYPAGYSYGSSTPATSVAPSSGQGGSHGGQGGSTDSSYATVYGNYRYPIHPGSGSTVSAGAAGGGALQVTAGGGCALSGNAGINADGSTSAAGGSILFECASLDTTSWAGSITANGGNAGANWGGGGGGRIAFVLTDSGGSALSGTISYPVDSASLATFKSRVRAYGGTTADSTRTNGGAGTIYLRHGGSTWGDLIVDNNNAIVHKGGGVTRLLSLGGTVAPTVTSTQFGVTATPSISTGMTNMYAGLRIRPNLNNDQGTPSNWSDDLIVTVASNTTSTVTTQSAFSGVAASDSFRSIDLFDHLDVGGMAILQTYGDIYVTAGSLKAPGGANISFEGFYGQLGGGGLLYPLGPLDINISFASGTAYLAQDVVGRNFTVAQGSSVTAPAVNVTGDVLINSSSASALVTGSVTANSFTLQSGTVKHEPTTSTAMKRLMMNLAGGFTLNGGSINLTGLGYPVGYSWGAGGTPATALASASNAGGSHGGKGGWVTSSANPGLTYDDFRDPEYPGGGHSNTGAGGGVLRVVAGGTCTVGSGASIQANGAENCAGGAGGTINLRCGGFAGAPSAGALSANGGASPTCSLGGGGGGRIALVSTGTVASFGGSFTYPSILSQLSTFKNVVRARGGIGASGGWYSGSGGAGTIYVAHGNSANGDLILDNTGVESRPESGTTRLVSFAGTAASPSTAGSTTFFGISVPSGYAGLFKGTRLRPDLGFTNGTAGDWTDDNVRFVTANTTSDLTLSSPLAANVANGAPFRSIEILDSLSLGANVILESAGDVYTVNGIHENANGMLGAALAISNVSFNFIGSAGLTYPGFTNVINSTFSISNSVIQGNLGSSSLTVTAGTVRFPSGMTAGPVSVAGGYLEVTGTANLGSLTISGTGTASVSSALNVTGDVTVSSTSTNPPALVATTVVATNYTQSSGLVTHPPTTETLVKKLELSLSGSLTMNGGSIDATGKGYLMGYSFGSSGPSTTLKSLSGGGGSHGGQGGWTTTSTEPGATYGDFRSPNLPGGGGGSAGNGGGVIRVAAGGACAVNGGASIVADGSSNCESGAGGSIDLVCGSFAGNASGVAVRAAGGNVNSCGFGGGGGGRVHLRSTGPKSSYQGIFAYPVSSATLSAFRNKVHARGGTGFSGTGHGAPGTVFLEASDTTYGDLIIDNGGIAVTSKNGVTVVPSTNAGSPSATIYQSTNTTNVQIASTGTPLANFVDLFKGSLLHVYPVGAPEDPLDVSHVPVILAGNTGNSFSALVGTFPSITGSNHTYRFVTRLDHLDVGGNAKVDFGVNGDVILELCDLHSAGVDQFNVPSGSAVMGRALASPTCTPGGTATQGSTVVFSNYYLGAASPPLASCAAIKTANPAAPNGTYTIDPDAGGPLGAFSASCDMTTDGGGWTLVLNYLHQGGTNPALSVRSTNVPLAGSSTLGVDESGTASWGHAGNALFTAFAPGEIRFACRTAAHGRVMDFKTNLTACAQYFATGTGACNGIQSSYTPLSGHTANLPGGTNDWIGNAGDNAMTEFPFFAESTYHWGIQGEDNRWECDDYANGYGFHTLHRVWVR
jgi:hypothetical protein